MGRQRPRTLADRCRPAFKVNVSHAAPSSCPDCGGNLGKFGENVTGTREFVPARWKGNLTRTRELLLLPVRGDQRAVAFLDVD